jgi:hypothetical protein
MNFKETSGFAILLKKWIRCEIYDKRTIKWKFKIFSRQIDKQLVIERKKLWKHTFFEMVDTGRIHKYDLFDQFLFENRMILDSNPASAAYRANKKFGMNLTKG